MNRFDRDRFDAMGKEAMSRVEAVSYTHLDVYKRQAHESAFLGTDFFPDRRRSYADYRKYSDAVSYTHLDVY